MNTVLSTTPRVLKLGPLSNNKEVTLKYDWTESGKEISVQGGDTGVVFGQEKSYCTAFFEAFPNKPACFIRGEGKTVEEAEEDAWQRYQKILVCKHEMERRNRTDGYGYCKHCSYSAMVFEPLSKCCKCGIPTAYSSDFRKKYYCKKHSINKPKSPNPGIWERNSEKRLPRKFKKQYKQMFAAQLHFEKGIVDKPVIMKKGRYKLTCENYQMNPFLLSKLKTAIQKLAWQKRWSKNQRRWTT